MDKTRRIIVSIVAIIYIILIIKKVHIPQVVYILLIGIILANEAIEEFNKYLQTRNKFYLLIPIMSVIIIIFAIFQLIYP